MRRAIADVGGSLSITNGEVAGVVVEAVVGRNGGKANGNGRVREGIETPAPNRRPAPRARL